MDKQQLSKLFERYLSNRCTDAEIELLLYYFQKTENDDVLKDLVAKALHAEVEEGFELSEDVIQAFEQTDIFLSSVIADESNTAKRGVIRYLHYGIAAAILLVCSFGLYLYLYKASSTAERNIQFVDVVPATDKAILTLTDGRKVVLDGNTDETLLQDGGITITRTADGQLIYTSQAASANSTAYNEIATPRGGQYQIILPDGSKVWLNAASKLKYPIQFSKEKREVELEGEAYFEVRSRGIMGESKVEDTRIPFIVRTKHQKIEVLGTHFNVSAYADEMLTKTTLTEGSVRVAPTAIYIQNSADYQPFTILKPGQQASSTGGNIDRREVDVENEISWKNGEFAFINTPLADILRDIGRWYDVEIDMSTVPQTKYTVFISRKVPLSSVLRMLEKTGNLDFAWNTANQIIITPKIEKPM